MKRTLNSSLHMHVPEARDSNSKAAAEVAAWLQRPTQKLGIRSLSRFGSAVGTAQGGVRTENQDRAVVASYTGASRAESFDLYAVCDGLGGMREGGLCASLALSTFVTDLIRTRLSASRNWRLQRAVDASNKSVYEVYREGGGTTIAAVLVDSRGASLVAVGDSRVYAYGLNNDLIQLTTDDTIAARVALYQGLKQPEVGHSPFSNQLAQFIGQLAPVAPQIKDLEDLQGQKSVTPPKAGAILLTTDGIHNMPASILEAVVRTADSARDLVSRLVSISEWIGGHDNATIVCMTPRSRSHVSAEDRIPGTLVLEDPFAELRMAVAYASDFDVTDHLYAGASKVESSDPYVGTWEKVPQQRLDLKEPLHFVRRQETRGAMSASHDRSSMQQPSRSSGKTMPDHKSHAAERQVPSLGKPSPKKPKLSKGIGTKGRKAVKLARGLKPAKAIPKPIKPSRKSSAKKSIPDPRPQVRIDIIDED